MKIIKLKEAGYLDSSWFWNKGGSLYKHSPFNPFLSFIVNYNFPTLHINSDLIVELREGYPTTHFYETKYVKRNWFMELVFGEKMESNISSILHKNKLTWIRLSNGDTYYVVESIKQIKKMISESTSEETN